MGDSNMQFLFYDFVYFSNLCILKALKYSGVYNEVTKHGYVVMWSFGVFCFAQEM